MLIPFRVTLNEAPGGKFTLVFDCMAEDAGHAAEQAENAYPGCNVLNCTEFVGNLPLNAWLRNLKPGDRVWWNDSDHHKSSGYYTIDRINGDEIIFDDAILFVKNADGASAEVLARELSAVKPENLQPVTDGDCGNGDLVGYAASKEEAIAVGNASLVDEVVDAYRVENITLRDGTQVDKAWVVLTHRIGEKARIRLTVDVTYDLNGVGAEAMCDRLFLMCVRAIDHGLLTADTDATVEAYSIDAARVEKPLTEEEVADWMRQRIERRIESGQLHPEDIALRLARYGLMEVPAFVAEMRERMEMAEAG